MRVQRCLLAWLCGLVLAVRPAGAGFIAYVNLTGAPGGQTWGGALGMDFVVNSEIEVTHLGVFDSGADGLARDLTAEMWARDDNGTPDNFADDTGSFLDSLPFSGADPGELIDSSRFKPLTTPLLLPPGAYTICAHGYGSGEPNGNEGAGGPGAAYKQLNDGGGLIAFVGPSRYGATPGQFPAGIDSGPANRYSAGTFIFVPEPATLTLLVGAGLTLRRRKPRIQARR